MTMNGNTLSQTAASLLRNDTERGDEHTKRFECLTITPNEDTYDVVAGDGDETTNHEFSENVDFVTINDTRISFDDPITIRNGVAFDYYWNVEQASIDVLL